MSGAEWEGSQWELRRLRMELDAIDQQMIQLFEQRMAISTRLGVLRKEAGVEAAIPDLVRAGQEHREAMVRDHSLIPYVDRLYDTILELAWDRQDEKAGR